jgi:ubiquinone/menaquinone biosynthesis C-methylase UbiE
MTADQRKELEMSFHDQREKDRQIMSKEDWLKKYSNKKWYSITRSSTNFVDSWFDNNLMGKSALDYCCGLGGTSLKLAQKGASVYGIDISPESVETARQTLEKEGYGEKSQFAVMDAESLSFEDNTFDVSVCSGVLHHLDVNLAFPELARVLKPDGTIIAIEALGYNPIIALYRKMTPKLRTAWEAEHILTIRELNIAKKSFENVQANYFHLFSILATPFRDASFFEVILRFLESLDSIILRLPGVRLMAWQMIFFLSKPLK